jgi:hypothetical protein
MINISFYISNWGKLGGCFRKAQLLKIKQARNNNRLIFPSYLLDIEIQYLAYAFYISIFWASRFATFGGSRRAIRSITRIATSWLCGWFRFYPSRSSALS